VNIPVEIQAIARTVSRQSGVGGETISVLARRSYPENTKLVWEALTVPDKLQAWFLPVHGDLRVGGQFQTECNEIRLCS
jgi:Activator of Hsp90 ATPase homolog 1-like protein